MRLEFIGSMVIFGAALFAVIGVVYFGNIDAGLAGLSVSYALSVTQALKYVVHDIFSETTANVVRFECRKN
jgi:ATP-binding cassette subfamily C (CFTR/MRP) protein 1